MLKHYKPTTQGRRNMSVTDYSRLSRKKPEKRLILVLKKSTGRDKTGQISIRHRSSGEKKKYRLISSLDQKIGMKAKVEEIEYDPNRTAFISLVKYQDGQKAYIIAWEGIKIKDEVEANNKTEIKIGNRMRVGNIPNGINIYDVELKPDQGGKIIRSAGNSAIIVAKEDNLIHLKMPSGEIRKINNRCFASIGQVSNISHSSQKIGKAGRRRHWGFRPSVRGKAMHPAAHPHGGGEGVNPIGLKYPKTPWGKPALGVKTRKKNKYSDKFIVKKRRV